MKKSLRVDTIGERCQKSISTQHFIKVSEEIYYFVLSEIITKSEVFLSRNSFFFLWSIYSLFRFFFRDISFYFFSGVLKEDTRNHQRISAKHFSLNFCLYLLFDRVGFALKYFQKFLQKFSNNEKRTFHPKFIKYYCKLLK